MSQREVPPEVKTVLRVIQEKLLNDPSKEECKQMSAKIGDSIKYIEDKEIQINKLEEKVCTLQSRDLPRKEKQGISSGLPNCVLGFLKGGSKNREGSRPSSSSKPTKKVQILNSIQTKASDKFATTLMTELNDFDCLMWNTGERLENNIPLIIVCLNSTRLKPDVELALAKVTYPAKYVVLIVHTGAESNLPAISSSKKLSGFQGNIKFIDIGFDVDYGGIYRCEQNDRALRQLREYIKHCG